MRALVVELHTQSLVIAYLIVIFLSQTGCTATARRIAEVGDAMRIRCDTAHDLADIRHETRDELAAQREELRRINAEREVQLARMEAERARLEMELCKANQEALQRQTRGNIRDNVETKTVFNVSHSLELAGPIKVNHEALKREQANPPEAFTRPPKAPCSSCDKVCGCGSGQIRRHCPTCCQKQCEAEKDCGGPEALRRAEQEPLQRPPQIVRVPVDVPMMISLTLNNPTIEETRITHEPVKRPPSDCVCTDPATAMMEQNANGVPIPIPPIPLPQVDGLVPEHLATIPGAKLFGVPPKATPIVEKQDQPAASVSELNDKVIR